MGKMVVSENVSLDGVIQDPAGDEGFRVGGWVGLIKDSPHPSWLASTSPGRAYSAIRAARFTVRPK
jgi:hypothetical protein